jgi:6-phosphogluconolactonase
LINLNNETDKGLEGVRVLQWFKRFGMKTFKYFLIFLAILLCSGCNPSSDIHNYYLLVGTYTNKPSQGIYIYEFDEKDGSLTYVSKADEVKNPSYIAISPNQKFVYAVNELGKNGSISAFSFNRKTGKLTFLNKQASKGGPAYVAVDHSGNYVFTGNYGNGTFDEFAVNNDGSLQPARRVVQQHGSSVNRKRQSSPHVHSTHLTPDNKFLAVTDLGTDYISLYPFDASSGKLNRRPVYKYKVHPGVGPRHVTFTPNGKYAYLDTEMGGTVIGFRYNHGRLRHIQTISAVTKTYTGRDTGPEIRVSPDGEFLYTSWGGGLNDITIFKINQQSGKLMLIGRQPTEGKLPRSFVIDPTGKYLLAANRFSNNIVVFKRNKSTGKLKPTGIEIDVHEPVCLKMVEVK